MKKLLYILPLFSLAFFSCEQDANVDVPEVDPQLVINCFITPQDSFIRAAISTSAPVFNSNIAHGPVTDATVTLYGNSSSVTLVYNATTQWYEVAASSFPILPGNEYHIVVSTPSGLNADAYATVPANPPVNFAGTVTESVVNNGWGDEIESRFEYSIDDQAGQADFYRLVPYQVVYSTWSVDTSLNRVGWELFSDENADGAHLTRNFTSYFYSSGDSLIAHDYWLLHCNYDYYRFHRSIENYSGDNPFAEPTLIYDNVNNGLGIFGAANGTMLRIWR
jgi:hypothetical protein